MSSCFLWFGGGGGAVELDLVCRRDRSDVGCGSDCSALLWWMDSAGCGLRVVANSRSLATVGNLGSEWFDKGSEKVSSGTEILPHRGLSLGLRWIVDSLVWDCHPTDQQATPVVLIHRFPSALLLGVQGQARRARADFPH